MGPKAAGFALMIRFFYTTLAAGPDAAASASLIHQINWPALIAVMSAVTMTYGNLVALRQDNVKRMLAYSSIAHVGYLLMGFVLLTDAGLQAILFYLLVYALMNLGAFLYVVAINNHLKSEHLDDYVGLGFRAPWAGVMMVIFLVSLTGIPPFAGFVGKFCLFMAVLDQAVVLAGDPRRAEQRGQPLLLLPGREGDVPDAPGRGRGHLAPEAALAAVRPAGGAGDPDRGPGPVLRALHQPGRPGHRNDDDGVLRPSTDDDTAGRHPGGAGPRAVPTLKIRRKQ